MKYGKVYLNKMKVDNFILTKYNVGMSSGKYAKRQEEWLEDRLGLFKKFTLSSVLCQECLPYKWLIFIDKHTDPEYHRRLWEAVYEFYFVDIVLTDQQSIVETARKRVNGFRRNECVITTRLDNDDAIHRLFIQRLQEEIRNPSQNSQGNFILNFDWGIVYNPNTGDARISLQGSNPFISKVERGEEIQTVWGFKHTEASRQGRLIRIGGKGSPMWIQTIHGKNVSNKMQGSPYSEHQDILNVEFGRYYKENFK